MEFGIQWPAWVPGPSLWSDFTSLYLSQLNYLSSGFMPYRDFPYSYTPFFLYSMLPFYSLGGTYAAAIPIVLADGLTAPVIYMIIRGFSSSRIAVAAGMAYALSPFALVNEGYIWLSPQPMTLFLLLSIYLLRRDRPVLAGVSLAIAASFKQEALFAVPVLLVYIGHNYRASLTRASGAFAATFVGVLSPFLLEAPRAVLNHIAYYLPFNPGVSEPAAIALAASQPQPNPIAQNCTSTAVAYLYTGSICGNIVDFKAWSQYMFMAKVDSIATFLAPILFVLLGVALVVVRRSPAFVQIACAYSSIAGFFVFSTLVHGVFAYYFVPVYALILASSRSVSSLSVAIVGATVAAFTPEGPFQFIIPITALFVLTTLEDRSTRRAPSTPSAPGRRW